MHSFRLTTLFADRQQGNAAISASEWGSLPSRAILGLQWVCFGICLPALAIFAASPRLLLADPGLPSAAPVVASPAPPAVLLGTGDEDGDGTWEERLLRTLAEYSLHAGTAAGTLHRCPEGGALRPACRPGEHRTVVRTEFQGCRVKVEGGAVLGATGELILALPVEDACNGHGRQACGTLTVETLRAVGTVADETGQVLRVIDFSTLPLPRTVVVPCAGGNTARAP
ncbi:MAG: hypothetical protein N3C12_01870 [Candidatus Binatia bacterium]|nr:hypothetical protein [Candidatus Binatia bacterium]